MAETRSPFAGGISFAVEDAAAGLAPELISAGISQPSYLDLSSQLSGVNLSYGIADKLEVPAQAEFPAVVDTTIRHVDPSRTLFLRHLDLLNGVRDRLADAADRNGLRRRLQDFFEDWGDDADVQALLGDYFSVEGSQVSIPRLPRLAEADVKVAGGDNPDNDSSALFKLSRSAMDDFHLLAGQRNALLALKRRKTRALAASRRRSAALAKDIDAARKTLSSREQTRFEAEEDYRLVRGLLEEQLEAVDAAFVERQRLLSNPVALCFVRVNDLPVTMEQRETPLVPKPRPGDLPEACGSDAGELPPMLAPFLELLADQPMSAWRALADQWHLLPSPWVFSPPGPSPAAYVETIARLGGPLAQLALPRPALPAPRAQLSGLGIAGRAPSQAVLARDTADRLTLEQLTQSRAQRLRGRARRLHEELATALACLHGQLRLLPAADRFAWSRLAEDDRLPTDRPGAWPGFDAHRRTRAGLALQQLIDWLHGQLADAAPASARAAVRTAIRACVLAAVNDDPADLLQGPVVQFPGLWQPGAVLVADLNRIPVLRAVLGVYDEQRRLIGEARVVDSEQRRARVEVLSVLGTAPTAFAGWTLSGRNGPGAG